MYEETRRPSLHRLKEMISDTERAQQQNALPTNQEAQLVMFKRQFDNLVQARLCYDVYFVANSIAIASSTRTAARLPLPLPPSPAGGGGNGNSEAMASLPEHVVESITTVLLSAMRYAPQNVDDSSSLLEC